MYKFTLLLIPAISFAAPSMNMQDKTCNVFVGNAYPQMTIDQCPHTVHSGAATVFAGPRKPITELQDNYGYVPGEMSDGWQTLTTTSDDNPGVTCSYTDVYGNQYESHQWEASFHMSAYWKDDGTARTRYELYCNRVDEIQAPIEPYIDLSKGQCKGYLGEMGPDMEGSDCATGREHAPDEPPYVVATYGNSLFHRYMANKDIIPKPGIGETVHITTYSDDYPGVNCTIIEEDGNATQSDEWVSTVTIRGLACGEYDEDGNFIIEGKDVKDQITINVKCKE